VLSVTVTEKLKGVEDATTGAVPVSAPAGDRASQAGAEAICHVNGLVPPDSVSVWLYASPDVIAGSELVVTAGAALIVSEKALVDDCDALSVTFRVKLTGPDAGG